MDIHLPAEFGKLEKYSLRGQPIEATKLAANSCRVVFSAAHVVADPFTHKDPWQSASIDWDATMAFRRYLHSLGLGIAEAMDTAQRGMGLNWPDALELIRRTKNELPDALVFSGAGTDQLTSGDARSLDQVHAAFVEQIEAVQKVDSRIILMASRALTQLANSPRDYVDTYKKVLSACDQPVILHWLGPMFDPALEGYWGSNDFDDCLETVLAVIDDNRSKVDGIKVSLLDKGKEISLRRRLPDGVKMYTGDDFNYPELMAGDDEGFSHALLGIFDPLASAAALAVSRLNDGDSEAFDRILQPTVPLARQIFRAPTQFYKTGVVFLAWLNGHQDHFIMLNCAQAMRPLPDFVAMFKLADQCGVLSDPELATARMKKLLSMYGAC